ncbi:MAG: penicillin-binding protein 2 [Pseudohongiellaceae bacterium]|jgi:penicillin-binding protein 2
MQEHQHFKNYYIESRSFAGRVLLTMLIILGLTALLLYRYYNLQILQHENFATLSDNNRILVQTISPQRGLIFDTNGRLLADNRPSYNLSLVPENIKSIDETIESLRTLIDVNENHVQDFYKSLNTNRRPYQPIPLRFRLTEKEISRIAVNEYRLDGVEVEATLVRDYPEGRLFAHSVGYVGKINDREWSRFDEHEVRRYQGVHTIGKIGLEKSYESILFGEIGYRNVEVNARMRVLRTLEQQNPVQGKDLQLHIDSHLQQIAVNALGGYRGSVVAIDIETGGVLAIVSTPSYDPNLFVTGISYKNYDALRNSSDIPLFDRALQGRYPPASTIKPMMGLGGLSENVISRSYKIFDPGFYQLEGEERLWRDWKRTGHGIVDVHKAIVQSSDTFFYGLAFRMGIDRIHDFGAQFGLGQKTGIDLPNERRGLWPSRQWKEQTQRLPWFPGDSLNVGIGQGFALATPVQMAAMVATIANRGKHMLPQVVKAIDGELLSPTVINQVEVADRYWDHIFKAMKDVMHASNGTARRAGSKSSYLMAGKTGTAQVVGIKQGEEYDSEALRERNRDHALFVGFAPFDNPKIAVAVIVENGESGSGTAAPIARKIFDAHLLNKKSDEAVSTTKLVSELTESALSVASSTAMGSLKIARRDTQ